jgi:hypothetical protein
LKFKTEASNSCLSSQLYIEPHFVATGVDTDYDALVEARWYEHLAEHYLKNSESDLNRAGSGLMVNTPVQLFLAHSRLARAQLEIRIYSGLLEQEIGKSLRGGVFQFPAVLFS